MNVHVNLRWQISLYFIDGGRKLMNLKYFKKIVDLKIEFKNQKWKWNMIKSAIYPIFWIDFCIGALVGIKIFHHPPVLLSSHDQEKGVKLMYGSFMLNLPAAWEFYPNEWEWKLGSWRLVILKSMQTEESFLMHVFSGLFR